MKTSYNLTRKQQPKCFAVFTAEASKLATAAARSSCGHDVSTLACVSSLTVLGSGAEGKGEEQRVKEIRNHDRLPRNNVKVITLDINNKIITIL